MSAKRTVTMRRSSVETAIGMASLPTPLFAGLARFSAPLTSPRRNSGPASIPLTPAVRNGGLGASRPARPRRPEYVLEPGPGDQSIPEGVELGAVAAHVPVY